MYWITTLKSEINSENALKVILKLTKIGLEREVALDGVERRGRVRVEQQPRRRQRVLDRIQRLLEENRQPRRAAHSKTNHDAVVIPLPHLRDKRVLGWRVVRADGEEVVRVARAADRGSDGVEAVADDGGVGDLFGDFGVIPGEADDENRGGGGHGR